MSWQETARAASQKHRNVATQNQRSATTPIPGAAAEIALTDLGNGQRFARDHGDVARYCYPWSKWLIWDGKRWKADDVGRAMALAKETVATLFTWAQSQVELLKGDGSDGAKARLRAIQNTLAHAVKSQHVQRLRAMVDLSRSEPGIPIQPDELDKDIWLLNCMNGTLDLRAGKLRPHSQKDSITKLCPVAFDPSADAPIFLQTVNSIFDGKSLMINYFRRYMGYALTGSIKEHALPIPFGSGSNGKTMLLKTILDVMGQDYAGTVPPELLIETKGDQHPTIKATLHGKRLMIAFETGADARLNEARVKALTGGDPIKARRMGEDFWQFDPTHKLLLCTNHKPTISGQDHAIWRRLVLWPFTQRYWDGDKGESGPPDLKADNDLPTKLRAEFPGILAWLVQGCLAWQHDGLAVPPEVASATVEYRDNEDRLGSFITDRCKLHPEFRAKSTELYGAFKAWSDANGEKVVTATKLTQLLGERGIGRDTGRRWYIGVSLANEIEY